MNNNLIIGRIYNNLELKYTKNGTAILELGIACNKSKEETLFLPINVLGKQAELCNQYLKKGDMIAINFSIKNHNWEDKEGKKHYDYNFVAEKVKFLNTKKVESKDEVKKDNVEEDPFKNFGEEITDDMLPF